MRSRELVPRRASLSCGAAAVVWALLERDARRLAAGDLLGERSKLACGVRMMPFLGTGFGERARSTLFSRDFMMLPRGDRDPSKLCCGERDLSIEPRGDFDWSKLPRGERCDALLCLRLALFGDLQTMTLVTRSRSGDARSAARLGERSRLMLLPLHERITLMRFSGAAFLSGDDLRDWDSCLPSSLTMVG